jgi:1,4-dihydroxy-6-naphthoate synthase
MHTSRHHDVSLELGLSSCPNDTFMFHALLHGLVDSGPICFSPVIRDVETLNQLAFESQLAVTKLSFHAFMKLRDRYALLDSGAAFGFGCGPLVVARDAAISLEGATVAIPGIHTTACMLLKAWSPFDIDLIPMPFDAILPAVRDGKVDAGVVIHEGRFVYANYGCSCLCDLGEWWESETKLPIPLGCIAVRRDHEAFAYRNEIEQAIRDSLLYARKHPDVSRTFVRELAGELDNRVIDAHIALYVNDYSLSLGDEGRAVVKAMEELI